ncbi:hypothetical protein BGZ72_001372 [Mortierella alpina]|nr:hypothetical protein BGZ72_001372 [Mortierella alpina]
MAEASTIVAIIALVATMLTAATGIYIRWYSDQYMEVAEDEKLIARYRDPILRAAQDLQSRLYNIAETEILSWMYADANANADANADANANAQANAPADAVASAYGPKKGNLLQFTCFLVGQYFAWTYILYRQPHFLYLATSKRNSNLVKTMDTIQWMFGTDAFDDPTLERPFYLWRGHQCATGEIMTANEGSETVCIGYATFVERWRDEPTFREWFRSLVEGITTMASARHSADPVPDHRVRRLQHMLVELIKMLESNNARPPTFWNKVRRALGLEKKPGPMYRDTLLGPFPAMDNLLEKTAKLSGVELDPASKTLKKEEIELLLK